MNEYISEYPEFLDKIVEDFIIESVNMSVQRAACRLLLLTLKWDSNSVFHGIQPSHQSKFCGK